MDLDLAEAIVKELLVPQYLSPIQQQVFRAAWNGESYPDFADRSGYEYNYIKGVGAQIWRLLSTATKRKVTKTNVREVLAEFVTLVAKPPADEPDAPVWDEVAIDIVCYGRERELELLHQWISLDRCRGVSILGMGGIGKTALVQLLVRNLRTASVASDDRFSYSCWHSLLAPLPLAELLPGLLRSLIYRLADNTLVEATLDRAVSVVAQIELLLEILKKHRCLLVFDNCESLFQAGLQAGTYRPESADYGELFSRVGQVRHQSCLILIGREKPNEIGQLAGIDGQVRELVLTGVNQNVADRIFDDRGCTPPTREEWTQIAAYCDGNPAIVHTIAATVRDVAGGNTSEIIPYLRSRSLGFADIHILLAQQWERLSEPELQVIYWLAIARMPLTLDALTTYLHPDWQRTSGRNGSLLSVLQSLNRRSLVSTQSRGANLQRQWSLLPMTIEYALDRLVATLSVEIETAQPGLLDTHAIVLATAPEYIRQQQLPTIVRPLLERLRSTLGNTDRITDRLRQILKAGRDRPQLQRGYLAGNIINLLIELQVDLTALDCAGAVIRQAYLATTDLSGIDLTAVQTIDCALAHDFARILTVAYSPNGRTFAAGDRRGEIRLWHEGCPERGEIVCQGHTNAVQAIAFSPDSRYLASVSDDRTIALWQVSDGRHARTIAAGIHGLSLSFSPDGRYLAVGSSNRIIYYWDLTTQMCVHQLVRHEAQVTSLCHYPYGGKLASGSADGTICIWDLSIGTARSGWNAHARAVTAMAYSPDGRTLLSSSLDGKLRLWDADLYLAGNCRLEINDVGGEIYAAAFSPDGLQAAIAGADGAVGIWSVNTGQCLRRWLAIAGQSAHTLAFRPDGEAIATAGDDRRICFWQARDGLCARILFGNDRGFDSIGWSRDGRVIFAGSDGRAIVRAIGNREGNRVLAAHPQLLRCLAVNPQTGSLATSGNDRTIKIWDLDTLTCQRTLHGVPPQSALTYSANGAYLIGAGDRTLRVWDTQQWRCVRTDAAHTERITALAHHPVREARCTSSSVEVSPVGNRDLFASASDDGTVRLWQIGAETPLRTIEHSQPVLALAFDPCGSILATGGTDNRIYLWNIDPVELSHTLVGHSGAILSIAYSPDGYWLCSGASDRTIKIWSMATRQCTATLTGHQDWVNALAISSCGRWLASAGADATVRIWEIATGVCIDAGRGNS